MDLFKDIDPFEFFKPHDPNEHPLPCVCDDALYGNSDARVFVYADDSDELGVLQLNFDSTAPPWNHWLAHEMSNAGVPEAFGMACSDVEEFLMSNGIAPGQRFLLHIRAWSSRDYWGEWDGGVEVEGVLWKEPWSDDRIACAWEALFGRRAMLVS